MLATLAAAADGGAFSVVIREKDLSRADRARLAVAAMELLHPRSVEVLVATDAALAHRIGADGVHLAASDPLPSLPVGIVGRSCHDTSDLDRAGRDGADYATVSPVFPSASKPGYGPPLGVDGLARAAAHSPVAVLALGGVSGSNAGRCLEAGAAGVAVMGAVMAADDPGRAVAELRASLGTPTPTPATTVVSEPAVEARSA